MPSTKPTIAIRTTEKIIEKFKVVANHENRSMANLAECLIKEYIKEYEAQHGEIQVGGVNCLISRPAGLCYCA